MSATLIPKFAAISGKSRGRCRPVRAYPHRSSGDSARRKSGARTRGPSRPPHLPSVRLTQRRHNDRTHPKALTPAERETVVAALNGERLQDKAPAEIYATLLDKGVYLCSESTMYRILRTRGEVRERRRQSTHPPRKKPKLMADAPNRVWSWDVTKLRGPGKRAFYCLYTMIDIYSRYTVGWMVTTHESEELAKHFIEDTVVKHGIDRRELTIHSDRGAIQTAKEKSSRPVDEDLLGGGCRGVVVRSFDECAVLEAGAGSDEGDQVRGVDRAPAGLGGLDEFERHR